MQFLRRLGLSLSVSLFSLLLLVFALFITVYKVLDTPASTQKALRTSGVYDLFVSNTLTQKEEQGDINLTTGDAAQDEVVRRAVQEAFSPTFVRQTTEQSLNHAYDWLHGKTPRLEVTVDVSEPKTRFADAIATEARTRTAALPVCPGPTLTPHNIEELLAATCRPADTPPEAIAILARQLALSSKIFDELTLTTNNLKDSEGRPISENLREVPTLHRYYIFSLYVIPVVLVLCALAIIFWSATRRGGTRRVAHILLWTGLLSAAWAVVAGWGLNRFALMVVQNMEGVPTAVQASLMRAVGSLVADIRLWWLVVSASYVLAAIILFFVARLMNQQTMHRVKELNKSLGYGDVPSAGTTFDPQKERGTAGEKTSEKPPKSTTKIQG